MKPTLHWLRIAALVAFAWAAPAFAGQIQLDDPSHWSVTVSSSSGTFSSGSGSITVGSAFPFTGTGITLEDSTRKLLFTGCTIAAATPTVASSCTGLGGAPTNGDTLGGSTALGVGITAGDNTGDQIRTGALKLKEWAQDIDANFAELYARKATYPEDYPSSCTIGTDASGCIQAALDNSKFTSGGATYFGHVRLMVGTTYNVASTITLDNAYGGVFDCAGATLYWNGANNIPLFLITNVNRPVFRNCVIITGAALQSAFELATSDTTHVASTGFTLADSFINGVSYGQTISYGVRFSNKYDGYTSTGTHNVNNDQSRIINTFIANCLVSCISIEHTNSLQHEFISVRGTGVLNSGAIVSGSAFIDDSALGGSFTSIGGHKSGFDTVYRIGLPYANVLIQNDDIESSNNWLSTTTNFNNSQAPVELNGGRFALNKLRADCHVIDFQRLGPLVLTGVRIDGDLSTSACGSSGHPLIYMAPNVATGYLGYLTARNNIFSWAQGSYLADVFSVSSKVSLVQAENSCSADGSTLTRCWNASTQSAKNSPAVGGTLKRTIIVLGDSYDENHFNHVGITGISSSGSTVTVTSGTDVPAGAKITIGHLTDECLNGMQTVATRVSSTQFTYSAGCTPAGTTWTVQATPSGNFSTGTASGTFTLNATAYSPNLAGSALIDNTNGKVYLCTTQAAAVYSGCADTSGSSTAPGVSDVIGGIALRAVADITFDQALSDQGWFNWYNALSGGGWDVVGSAGVGASTIADVPLQIQRDVFATMPAWALLFIGTNDVNAIGTVSQSLCNAFIASYQAAVRTMTAQGIRVIGATIMPRSTGTGSTGASATKRTNTAYINQKLREWARTEPLFYLEDQYAAMIDPFNATDVEIWGRHGDTETNYTTDGIHPSAGGSYYIAKRFLGLPSLYTGTVGGTFSTGSGTLALNYAWPGPTGQTILQPIGTFGNLHGQISCTATAGSASLTSCYGPSNAGFVPLSSDYFQTIPAPPLDSLARSLAANESVLPCSAMEDVALASGRNQIATNPMMLGSVAVSAGTNVFDSTGGISGTLPTAWQFAQAGGTTALATIARADSCGYDEQIVWSGGPNPGSQAFKTPNLASYLSANDQVYVVAEINPKGYAYLNALTLGTYMNGTNTSEAPSTVLSACLLSSGAYQRFDQAISGPITCRTPPMTFTAAMTDLRFGVQIGSGSTSAGEIRVGRLAVYRK